ncbi:MAG: hypothetical protein U5L72_15310 [Bacteroidales bacterium]|nr:hypothetical protein [Bacteroidales bacterium]
MTQYIAHCPLPSHGETSGTEGSYQEGRSGAEEKISYGMPAFFLNCVLYFTAQKKNHIGILSNTI